MPGPGVAGPGARWGRPLPRPGSADGRGWPGGPGCGPVAPALRGRSGRPRVPRVARRRGPAGWRRRTMGVAMPPDLRSGGVEMLGVRQRATGAGGPGADASPLGEAVGGRGPGDGARRSPHPRGATPRPRRGRPDAGRPRRPQRRGRRGRAADRVALGAAARRPRVRHRGAVPRGRHRPRPRLGAGAVGGGAQGAAAPQRDAARRGAGAGALRLPAAERWPTTPACWPTCREG